MSFVATQPESLAAAARDVQAVGSAMAANNAAAATTTTGVVPAATDEVSALTAAQLSAQAAAVREVFGHHFGDQGGSYAATEAANVIAAG